MKEKIYSIGIDVSKQILDICLMGKNLHVLELFKSKNSANILSVLEKKLANYELDSGVCIIVESTSSYHVLPALLLQESGYKIKVINPLSGYRYSAKASIRNCKTDKTDAIKLAEIGIRHSELPCFETTCKMIQLKKKISILKFFLKKQQSTKASVQQFKEALETIGLQTGESYQSMLVSIKQDQSTITKLENEIKKEAVDLKGFKEISSIKGISETSASIILGYINDKDFVSKHALVAFAGLDVDTKQSGSSIRGRGRISKKGNNMLRSALTRSVWGLVMHNDKFKELNDYYKSKGKHYFERLVILARKLLRIIYGMLKNNSPFDFAKIVIPKAI